MKTTAPTEDSLPGCLGRQAASLRGLGRTQVTGWQPVSRDRQAAYLPHEILR